MLSSSEHFFCKNAVTPSTLTVLLKGILIHIDRYTFHRTDKKHLNIDKKKLKGGDEACSEGTKALIKVQTMLRHHYRAKT